MLNWILIVASFGIADTGSTSKYTTLHEAVYHYELMKQFESDWLKAVSDLK